MWCQLKKFGAGVTWFHRLSAKHETDNIQVIGKSVALIGKAACAMYLAKAETVLRKIDVL